MPIQLNEENGGKMLAVHVSGKLAKADYEHFVPEFERLVRQHGKLRVLFDMTGFHGWEAGALWEDTKFAMQHFADIERLAMVGEKKWQEGMATFCKPFTKATIRYFDHADAAEARKWLARGVEGLMPADAHIPANRGAGRLGPRQRRGCAVRQSFAADLLGAARGSAKSRSSSKCWRSAMRVTCVG